MTRRGGLTLIELLVVVAIVAVLAGLTLGAVQKVRTRATQLQCANQLRQIGVALHHHQAAAGRLPPGALGPRGDYPYLAWPARLLPYLEQSSAWAAAEADYKRERHFGGPPPHGLLGTPMPAFLCPAGGPPTQFLTWEKYPVAFTHYLGVAGGEGRDDGLLVFAKAFRLGDAADGTSSTLLVGERPPSADFYLGWWYAGVGQNRDASADSILIARQYNYTFRAPTCGRGPYHYGPGDPADMCSTFHFYSNHGGGANFLFADGAVRFLSYAADAVLPALATRAGGEAAAVPD